ncbi:AsmA family protein [Oscillatoria amoena NRMC-F 0135]|nr:AsmA family protein [Oscillatoria amoena NRMC-F 0135]
MKKFFKITAIVVVVLLGVVIALPFIFKGKIVELVKKEANKQLTATVDFDNDISLSLFKNFPQFTIELKKFSIADSTDSDTLVSVQRFSATLDVMSVISGDKVQINSIVLDNPRIYAKVRKDGKANWDIMKPSTDTATAAPADTTSSFKLGLKKFEIINGRIVYDDQQGGIYSALEGLNHILSGDFTQDLFTLQTKTDAQAVTVGMDGLNYLNKVKANLKADLEMDMKQMKFTFKENELQLNELFAGFDGFVAMPAEDIQMDLKFAARKTDFKNILSLIPAVYTKDFANVKTSGKLGLDGSLKGIYNEKSLPAFIINLVIDNGMFQYPGMPADMRSIFVNLNVTNPDGVIDNTVIDLKKFDFVLANEPFSARLLAKNPTTDPYVDMNVKGRVDLAQVSKLAPLEKRHNP